jgi:exo-beta-1,3-glucanase (GH17 family)
MRPRKLLLTVLVALGGAALTGLGWWLPNRPAAAGPRFPDGRLNAVSFAPFRPGQSPLTGRFPSAAEVAADLALLAPHVRAIRSYAAIEGDYDLPALAARQGLKLWLGIWLGQDRVQNGREIARGIAIARAWPGTVERVIVGNEVLLRRDLPPAELMADIDTVRAAVSVPVTYADVWEFWQRTPDIAAHVDAVTVHLLPYWEDTPTGIAGAVAQVRAVFRQMQARFPGKPVVIGETGWPSAGRWRRDAAPSRVNQASFVRRFVAAAVAEGFDYNLIEAFDQDWKAADEGTVGARWGLWTADRQAKFLGGGPVVEDPAWRWRALAAVGLGLLLAAAMLVADWRLAALGLALGNALVFAWAGTVPIAFLPGLRLAAAVNLPGQGLLAWLLLDTVRRRLAGEPASTAPNAAEATAHLRALLRRGRLPPREAWLDDVTFLFTWTAALLQLLLVIDPRYRDFPTASFAVPLVTVAARGVLLRDFPRGGGGREEFWLAAVLILGAVASAVQEGFSNRQSLVWNAAALVLALPIVRRLLAAARPSRPALRPAHPR